VFILFGGQVLVDILQTRNSFNRVGSACEGKVSVASHLSLEIINDTNNAENRKR
jgi:hypothetical protein